MRVLHLRILHNEIHMRLPALDKTVHTVYTVHIQKEDAMDIVIRTASDEPLYSQIYRQLRDQIIAGTLAPGDALPSIRSLARDLRISVITTKRAYDELERDGLIVTAAARGCFVAQKDMTRIREDRLMQVEQLMAEAVSLAAACGLSEDELVEMLRMQLRGGAQ